MSILVISFFEKYLFKSALAVTFVFAVLLLSYQSLASEKALTKTEREEFFYSGNIKLVVDEFPQAVKFFHWLDQIVLTETGQKTIEAINQSNHQLTILHSNAALVSAGVTSAPMSSNLTNGKGESVEIKLYLDMESEGTNCVLGETGQYIRYTAIQNLFHELSHARHKMNGTWLYFASERQAIIEENKFRYDWLTIAPLSNLSGAVNTLKMEML